MDIQFLEGHRVFLDKFIKACQTDERIIASYLVGSYVKGRYDKHSDLDLYLITRDDSFNDFVAGREAFVRSLGEPSFMEDFDLPGIVFLIFPDGLEVEISYDCQSRLPSILTNPFKILVDKKNITTGVVPQKRDVDENDQKEKLRRLIFWFWHEMSHFITAMGRGQFWWAHGQLGALRNYCMNLTRLRNNFYDPDVGEEGYFKIENVIPIEQLSSLQESFCPMEREAMLKAGFILAKFYKTHAKPLALEHGIDYPNDLEEALTERLKGLQ